MQDLDQPVKLEWIDIDNNGIKASLLINPEQSVYVLFGLTL